MSTSNTLPPQFEGAVVYERPAIRALTNAQERLAVECLMRAQEGGRMEAWWINGKLHVQLVRTEERQKA